MNVERVDLLMKLYCDSPFESVHSKQAGGPQFMAMHAVCSILGALPSRMTDGAEVIDDLDAGVPKIAFHGMRAISMGDCAAVVAENVAWDNFRAHLCFGLGRVRWR